MDTHITERRHVPDRRAHSLHSATHTHAVTSGSRMNAVDWLAMTLLIIGGLNWGLVGLFNFDLVATLFGQMSAVSRAVYVAVGLSALYSVYTATKMSHRP
jgi:uncharacterized membrane protein YuzA (DUF378 family)